MSREITLDHITKIEGHAKLHLGIDKGTVTACELSATEGARYFEGLVRGRPATDAPEITSRICGICSCAHVVASCMAVEEALGMKVSQQTKALRILMTLGERIRSHATHLYFLSLPDYLGFESALAMGKSHKPELQRALRLMQAGNAIIKTLAARDLHPVSSQVGGWLALPAQDDIAGIHERLLAVRDDAIATCELFSRLDYPDMESAGEYFALVAPDAYAVLDGVFTGQRARFEKGQYRDFVKEYHEPYSSSNFVVAKDHRYWVGALARINHSHERLSDDAKRMLAASGIPVPSKNPYHNTVAQAVEMLHCVDHALALTSSVHIVDERPVPVTLRAGRGVGAIEVPRGTLWHEYETDERGVITYANIITPTAQNLLNIQEDIRGIVPSILDKEKDALVMDVEKLIRSYDPCFSCSAHFLEVDFH